MFSLPNHKFTQIAEANKLYSVGRVSLFIALFWEVGALGKQKQDNQFVRQFLLLLKSYILDSNGVWHSLIFWSEGLHKTPKLTN